MNKRILWSGVAAALFFAGVAIAQYPLLDMAASDVVAHYQNASCEQLWQERAMRKGAPKSDREKEMIKVLHEDAQMRAVFIGKVAAPVVGKMFECGMIP